MDGVPAPVAYIDREEHCHYVNRTFLQYFGLTAAQVAELRLRDVVGHGIYQSAQAMLTRAMEGESTAFDRLVPGANGVRRWMTIRVVPDAAPSGDVHGAFVLMNDIHGLKQAQEALRDSEAALRLIMDNVPARVSYIDRDYRYRFLNRHNEEWLGESRKELAGRKVHEVSGEERFLKLQPLLDRVLEGETISEELMLPQPDGEMKWEGIHYAPNRDSAIKLADWLVSDEAQRLYAELNFEYPVKPGIAIAPAVAAFGTLKPDTLPLTEIARTRKAASEMVDQVGFDN
jgi:PAS domain S-box-containing protein